MAPCRHTHAHTYTRKRKKKVRDPGVRRGRRCRTLQKHLDAVKPARELHGGRRFKVNVGAVRRHDGETMFRDGAVGDGEPEHLGLLAHVDVSNGADGNAAGWGAGAGRGVTPVQSSLPPARVCTIKHQQPVL